VDIHAMAQSGSGIFYSVNVVYVALSYSHIHTGDVETTGQSFFSLRINHRIRSAYLWLVLLIFIYLYSKNSLKFFFG
jgi:hypothetical protein